MICNDNLYKYIAYKNTPVLAFSLAYLLKIVLRKSKNMVILVNVK